MIAILIGLTLIGGLLLQSTVLVHFRLFGVQPDLMLTLAVLLALLRGSEKGMLAGLFAGLLKDMVSGGIIGLDAIPMMVVGGLTGAMECRVFKDNPLVPVVVVFCATVLEGILRFLIEASLGWTVSMGVAIFGLVIPAAVYNSLVGLLIYGSVRKFNRYLMKYRPAQRWV